MLRFETWSIENMTEQEAKALLEKFEHGNCTPEEKLLLYSFYNEFGKTMPDTLQDERLEKMYQRIWMRMDRNRQANGISRSLFIRVAATVAIVIGLGTTYFVLTKNSHKPSTPQVALERLPGTNKAILTLANGKQIDLDSKINGTIAKQGNVSISKAADGQLVYTIEDGIAGSGYNTISTPNGGQYFVKLPDGSTAFLNAGSSLKFPLHFNHSERRVQLSGEAYFEIAKDPGKPFRVVCDGQLIEVLGTHFNVYSYAEEPRVTTLVEGRINATLPATSKTIKLKPGQQSITTPSGFNVEQVNANDVIAWKDGLFIFHNTSLKNVVRQLARWYDVEVDYSTLPDTEFNGEISRKDKLTDVLKLLETASDVPLTFDGRRIMRK
ncbi:FecR family protein [Chitinophaga agri]|uniref:DUF4974 domain-containing protein n=1 Tax=Chitinophaga agri TaxID=2703787 RepID=A0A6B9ZPX6_9BACT|nr:FecR family protein [Chitinophaga agri]QHS63524.1 DUF4974 domain-containing protein [Chitinophaga agri]